MNSKGELSHQGIYLTADGVVNLQLSAKSVGLFEAFYNSVKVRFYFLMLVLECTCVNTFSLCK